MTNDKYGRIIIALEMLLIEASERISTAEIQEYFSIKYGVDLNRQTVYKYIKILSEFYNIDFEQGEGWMLH